MKCFLLFKIIGRQCIKHKTGEYDISNAFLALYLRHQPRIFDQSI
jgi:hypothetical protein